MGMKKKRALEVPLKAESYNEAFAFIEQWMKQHGISEKTIYETGLLFEALFQDMIDQGFPEDTILTFPDGVFRPLPGVGKRLNLTGQLGTLR